MLIAMGEVVRPEFGARNRGTNRSGTCTVFAAVHVFGEAGGCRVSIIHDETDPVGDVLKVVVGEVGSDEVEAVAVLPASIDGKREAVIVGLAILRTLEMMESINNGPPV